MRLYQGDSKYKKPGKILDRLSWPVVPAKVTLARDQQSLCHWLILSPTQHPYWETMTVLLLLHKRCHGNHRFLYAASKSDFTKSDGFQKPVERNFKFVLYDMIHNSLKWRVHPCIRCGGHSFIKAFSNIGGVRKRLGRFHGDLRFVGTCVKQEMGLTGVNGLGLMTYWLYHSR